MITNDSRAISQKLGIKYFSDFNVKLVEINAHSLASKYFSESGKLVQRFFDSVEAMLQTMEKTFVIVLIDEVETLTARRDNAMNHGEPLDGMKVSRLSILGGTLELTM